MLQSGMCWLINSHLYLCIRIVPYHKLCWIFIRRPACLLSSFTNIVRSLSFTSNFVCLCFLKRFVTSGHNWIWADMACKTLLFWLLFRKKTRTIKVLLLDISLSRDSAFVKKLGNKERFLVSSVAKVSVSCD